MTATEPCHAALAETRQLEKQTASNPENRAEFFRDRRLTPAAVALLLMVQAGLLAWSATKHSPTMQEPAQLAAGISNWEFGRFELYRVNPPLVRMIAALPVLAAGYEADWSSFYESPGSRPEFAVGSDFIAANGERSIWLFTIARWACIPISLLGGLFCFFWARELWGTNGAGLVPLFLWCFDPNILAHAELINTDAAATTFGVGATYTFWRWLRQPTWTRAGVAGLLLGLAQLSKMSWLFLFGLWPLLWVVARVAAKRSRVQGDEQPSHSTTPPLPYSNTPPPRQLVTILMLALYLLNLGYGFDGSCTQLGEYTFVSETMSATPPGEPGNRFDGNWVAQLPVPLPKHYLLGFDLQRKDFEDFGQPSYLRGEWKDGGWWYYYLYGLAVKMPHGTQLLLLLVLVMNMLALVRTPHPSTPHPLIARSRALDLTVLHTPPLILFVLVSAQLEFNHHLRYVLPCLGFLFVFLGQAVSLWTRPCKR